MLLPHWGQGRQAHVIRDLKEIQGPAILIFVRRETSKSRMVHEPLEEIKVAGTE